MYYHICKMSFYISPPGGNISLQKLSRFATTRLNFLIKIYDTGGDRIQIFDIVKDEEQVLDSECLIEGTVKDRLSHFILRLACCSDRDMAAFLVKAETFLFDFRFNCMTEDELCKLFKSIESVRHASKTCDFPSYVLQFLDIMSLIKGEYKWRTVVKRYLKGDIDSFMVPFCTVLKLVSTRQVVLKNGMAHVPFCKLREVVVNLFEELIQNGLKHAGKIFKTDDQRIKLLLKTLKVLFYEHYKDNYPGSQHHYDFCHTNVDMVAQMFPPCMLHLHRSLRTSHRLKHHSRVQYTLFLKEVGLPIHEALMFWRKEYMQSPNTKDGCTHMWLKDEGRYTYNIRHLYGLEGSRINYRGHSCIALQENYSGTNENGGCPFSHFDSDHLLELLHRDGISSASTIDEILNLSKEKKYSQACTLYYMAKIQEKAHNNGFHNKVEYSGKCKNPEQVTELGSVMGHTHKDNVINDINNLGDSGHCDKECNEPEISSHICCNDIHYSQKKCGKDREVSMLSNLSTFKDGLEMKQKSVHKRKDIFSCQCVLSNNSVTETVSDKDFSNCDCFTAGSNIKGSYSTETIFNYKTEMIEYQQDSSKTIKTVLSPAAYFHKFKLNETYK